MSGLAATLQSVRRAGVPSSTHLSQFPCKVPDANRERVRGALASALSALATSARFAPGELQDAVAQLEAHGVCGLSQQVLRWTFGVHGFATCLGFA